jgi:hypothetical protein
MYPCVLPFKKIPFSFFFSNGATYHSTQNLFAPMDEFLEPLPSKPIIASRYELHRSSIAMVREQTFSG